MVEVLQFQEQHSAPLQAHRLSLTVLSSIFLGSPVAEEPVVAADAPPWARSFIQREFRACVPNFEALRDERETAPHPRTGVATGLETCFISRVVPGRPLAMFKVFGRGDAQFCLVFAGLLNRVTHVIIADLQCIIFDLDRAGAVPIWEAFVEHGQPALDMAEDDADVPRRIGVIDMVTSYAHQAMNHLSGLQRLIDSGLDRQVDEIWVCGTEFFGRTADIFPELVGKIRHVSREFAAESLGRSPHRLSKIGSNFITASLHERLEEWLRRQGGEPADAAARSPVIAVTVRSMGRRCRNLPEVVGAIVAGLLPRYPKLGVVLDGWVFPETKMIARSSVVTAISGSHLARLREEAVQCEKIAARLPAGVLVGNVVGLSLLQSLRGLRGVDAYFAHAGTLQHKIAWFTGTNGVVHGPRTELSRLESSYYASARALTPRFVDGQAITDHPGEAGHDRSNDYEITDSGGIIRVLTEILGE